MRDFYLDRENRKIYLVTMLKILRDKYHVDLKKLSIAMGVNHTYMHDLINFRRNPLHSTMDNIEEYINDLYDTVVDEEIRINGFYFKELSARSVDEEG